MEIGKERKARRAGKIAAAARDHGKGLIKEGVTLLEVAESIEAFIYDKLLEAQEKGADIAKMAVMPKNYADVLTLLGATLKARTGAVNIPIITMSMGPEGGVTRVAGGLFGSDLTFAIGKESSAPGQIPISDLRQAMAVLY